jgi:signal transduction histidine kinase
MSKSSITASASSTTVPVERRGLGLLSMRERMQAAHGLLEIESVPGKGTRVCAWVPG